jgi:uncharacterized RDD family membrane protein YckC
MNYANGFRRLTAFIIDLLVVYVPAVIIYLVARPDTQHVAGFPAQQSDFSITFILILVVTLFLGYFNFAMLPAESGQTFGMKRMGIKIINCKGQIPSEMDMYLRIWLLSLLGVIGIIFALPVFFTEKHQGIHDMIFKTYIVKA